MATVVDHRVLIVAVLRHDPYDIGRQSARLHVRRQSRADIDLEVLAGGRPVAPQLIDELPALVVAHRGRGRLAISADPEPGRSSCCCRMCVCDMNQTCRLKRMTSSSGPKPDNLTAIDADQFSTHCTLLTRASPRKYNQPNIAIDTAAPYASLPNVALHEERKLA